MIIKLKGRIMNIKEPALVLKSVYTKPKILKLGRMVVHTNGATSRTNDPGGNVGGKS